MRKVILYIEMGLDGYIADCRKSVDWIKGQDGSVEMPDTFSVFANVGTVIMGRRIYGQITTELSPYMWPYSGAMTYVLTHNAPMADTVNNLQEGTGKNIRICGGADVIKSLDR